MFLNLTLFVVHLLPVVNGILFVQKWEKIGFRSGVRVTDSIRVAAAAAAATMMQKRVSCRYSM